MQYTLFLGDYFTFNIVYLLQSQNIYFMSYSRDMIRIIWTLLRICIYKVRGSEIKNKII